MLKNTNFFDKLRDKAERKADSYTSRDFTDWLGDTVRFFIFISTYPILFEIFRINEFAFGYKAMHASL
jgi:hypothetical protein